MKRAPFKASLKATSKTSLKPPSKPPAKPARSAKPEKSAASAKAGTAKSSPSPSKVAPPKSKTTAPPPGNREKLNVKDAGAKAKPSSPSADGKLQSKTKTVKGAPVDPKAGAKKKGGKSEKPVVPAAPPRKIQVVQMSTLKPGARGTKASVARTPGIAVADEPPAPPAAAKKRRSAELTAQQLEHFKELLQVRRARLSSDLSLMQDEALKVTAQDNSSDSVADTGTDNYEQDFTLGLIESEEALAREVDQALVRLEGNTFGVCEACQTPIPLARLEILPFARMCVECQQKREGRP